MANELRRIRISDGNEVVGFGRLRGDGSVECDAELGEGVYDAIESAIEGDADSAEVGGTTYRWVVE